MTAVPSGTTAAIPDTTPVSSSAPTSLADMSHVRLPDMNPLLFTASASHLGVTPTSSATATSSGTATRHPVLSQAAQTNPHTLAFGTAIPASAGIVMLITAVLVIVYLKRKKRGSSRIYGSGRLAVKLVKDEMVIMNGTYAGGQ